MVTESAPSISPAAAEQIYMPGALGAFKVDCGGLEARTNSGLERLPSDEPGDPTLSAKSIATAAPAAARGGDLTTPVYWDQQNRGQSFDPQKAPPGWRVLAPHLAPYEDGRFLEIGCSPGHVSAQICSRIRFRPEGIDFAKEADLYLRSMDTVGVRDAKLHSMDVRRFEPEHRFDVVASFGLAEHFADPSEILAEHDRLTRPGGLVVVAVPNYRNLPFAYHWLFDRPDLRRHNLATMRPEVFRAFGKRFDHEILALQHSGRLEFWNCDTSGGRFRRNARRGLAWGARLGAKVTGRALPADHAWFAPWLVYVGRKPAG